jgi:hypothetical protein
MSEFYTRDTAVDIKLPRVERFLKAKHEKFFVIIAICETLFLKGLAKRWWRLGMNTKINHILLFFLCERMCDEPELLFA